MLNTPVQSQTPTLIGTLISTPATQNIVHQQTPVRNQLINQPPISAAQAVSRKLIQKSVKLLNAPRSSNSDVVSTGTTPSIKLFPFTETTNNTGSDSHNIPQLKTPIASNAQVTSSTGSVTPKQSI